MLASRRSRDYAAAVYADLVAGTIPASGGSTKYPCVDASEDALFRLWVPRDFAISRKLKIVTDPKESNVVDVELLKAELEQQKQDLLAKVAVIEAAHADGKEITEEEVEAAVGVEDQLNQP